jgi:prepilin-type N-terminal cleavage/methylation domain-containing protein
LGEGLLKRALPRPPTSGFSLVEVALAVAVIAIGLLVVIGLFPQGLQSARDAADNTMSATIVQDLFSYLRSYPFSAPPMQICPLPIPLGNPGYPGCDLLATQIPINLNLANGNTTLNFDQDGLITTNPYVVGFAGYYQVLLAWQAQGAPVNRALVEATVIWPAQSPAPMNTNIFVTMIATYQ